MKPCCQLQLQAQLRAELNRRATKLPCSLCRAAPGFPCRKPSGVRTSPHTERRNLANAETLKEN